MATTYMGNTQIIRSRILNQIQLIKYGLSKINDFDLYNDLLIVGQIVPKLPDRALVQVLQTLKTLND